MHPGHVLLTSYLRQNFLALKKTAVRDPRQADARQWSKKEMAIFISTSGELNQASKIEMKSSQLNTS